MNIKFVLILLAALCASPTKIYANQTNQVIVKEIQDKSASSHGDSCGFYGIWSTPGDAVRELVIDEIMKSGKVTLIENEEFLAEKEGSAKVTRSKTPKINSYAIAGVINEFEWCLGGQGIELDVGGLIGLGELSVGGKSSKAHVAIQLRLVDLSNGKIVGSFQGEAQIDDSGFEFGTDAFGLRLKRTEFEKAPLGKATRAAVVEAVGKILGQLAK